MGLGLFFGLCASVYAVSGSWIGWEDLALPVALVWAGVPLVLLVAAGLSSLARHSVLFPRMVLGTCSILAPATFASALLCMTMGEGEYGAAFLFWAFASVAAIWIARSFLRNRVKHGVA